MEPKEIQARFFLCYFLYSKMKYGASVSSQERLAKMSAYKSVMNIYKAISNTNTRVKVEVILERFNLLHQEARALHESEFKRVFLATYEQLDLRYYFEASSLHRL